MNPWSRVVQLFGLRKMRWATASVVVVLLGAGIAAAGLQAARPGRDPGVNSFPELSRRAGDEDFDSVPDLVENRFGSRPDRFDSLGQQVPDGWVYHWFGANVDWNATGLLDQPALLPPAAALPSRVPLESLATITIAELYRLDSAGRQGSWWLEEGSLNPTNWDNDGDFIADVWLLGLGLHPSSARPDDAAPGDPSFTLRQKYDLGLDPRRGDSDTDGLSDRQELEGHAEFGGLQRTFLPTDPRASSTRSDPVPDGFVVRFGFDPHNTSIANHVATPGGLSVLEAAAASLDSCPQPCDWSQLLAEGPLVDPTDWDSNDDGVPDAWIYHASHGTISPLADARKAIEQETAAWDAEPWGGDPSKPSVVVDELNGIPAPANITLADLYVYGRSPNWDEASMGPWWGGLPMLLQSPPGSLPSAVALRGWDIGIDHCLGCNTTERADTIRPRTVGADPRLADSDQDGLTDLQEYLGWDGKPIPRSDPLDADTDADGLTDRNETLLGTHSRQRDTAGSFLSDGESFQYWTGRLEQARLDLQTNPEAAGITYGFLRPPGASRLTEVDLARLGPLGHLRPGTPNLLAGDADGDGIANGAELFPNDYLDIPTTQVRPATDPAQTDSDGDRLPDAWETRRWSKQRHYDCPHPCLAPPGFTGWPLNPAQYDSFNLSATRLHNDGISDFDRTLKDDRVGVPGQSSKPFTTGLAYEFDLSPYDPDTSPQDRIPDMFAIHWGIRNIPADVRQSIEGGQHAWAKATGESIEGRRPRDVGQPVDIAVIDPRDASTPVDHDSNLREMFYGHQKGIWVHSRCLQGTLQGPLPTTGPRADGAGELPPRQLSACWTWLNYPVASDLQNGTNPWKQDSDADGVPDAWMAHYFAGEDAPNGAAPTLASQAGGCGDLTATQGLPAPEASDEQGYCLSHREAYLEGLHPRLSDTDGGGLADWIEIALRNAGEADLDPLDPLDDRGEEDWDADGLLNRVEDQLGLNRLLADSDLDGLLDGDAVGVERTGFIDLRNGNGDLCMRTGPDLVPGTTNRPGGPLTFTQAHQSLVASGIVHDSQPGEVCPSPASISGTPHPYWLFKREAMLDRWSPQNSRPVMLGAGQGSDSLDWDTPDNGLPDGWVVYWRDRPGNGQSTKAQLDPTDASTAKLDPDQDLETLSEYQWGRPAAWNESRHGTWWGGLDPTRRDTDGDEDWFSSVFDGGDAIDRDGDGDGLPAGLDPFMDADHDNEGYHAASGTNFTRLWSALASRPTADLLDRDGDLVPDALDRARATVSATVTQAGSCTNGNCLVGSLNKQGGSPLTVQGNVRTFEPKGNLAYVGPPASASSVTLPDSAPSGAAIANATVKLLLADAENTAVLAVAQTDHAGNYRLDATFGAQLTGPVLASNATMHGQLFAKGSQPTLNTGLANIKPGPVRVWVMLEPNDAGVQPLEFVQGAVRSTAAHAYKDVSPGNPDRAKFHGALPGEAYALQAVRLGQNGPDKGTPAVEHAAEAVWPAHSPPLAAELRSQAILHLGADLTQPKRGETLTLTALLNDANGVSLPGRDVTVALLGAPPGPHNVTAKTSAEGTVTLAIDTGSLQPGPLTFYASSHLGPGDQFLQPPPPRTLDVTVVQDTTLSALRIDNAPRLDGEAIPFPAEAPLTVSALLLETPSDSPIANRKVTITVEAGPILLWSDETTTLQDGSIAFDVGPIGSGLPMQALAMTILAEGTSQADSPATATFRLLPQFATRLSITDSSGTGTLSLKGTLERVLYTTFTPLAGAHGTISATSGTMTLWTNVTGPNGTFQFSIPSTGPLERTWVITFQPAAGNLFLGPAPAILGKTTHRVASAIQLDPATVDTGKHIIVSGRLSWGGGQPAGGQNVRVHGSGIEVTAAVGADGRFTAALPPRQTPGETQVNVTFAGTPTFGPSSTSMLVQILAPTTIAIQAPDAAIAADGRTDSSISIRLTDASGPLAARPLKVNVTSTGASATLRTATNSDGVASIRLADLALAIEGPWAVQASYEGTRLHRPSHANATFNLTLHADTMIQRVPALAHPGGLLQIQGLTKASPGADRPIGYTLLLDGKPAGAFAARTNLPWHAQVPLPTDLGVGLHWLEAVPDNRSGMVVQGARAQVAVQQAIGIHVDVVEFPDGGRRVDLRTEGADVTQPFLVTVARRAPDGSVWAVHDVTISAAGNGTLVLGPEEGGTLTVIQAGHQLLAVHGLVIDTRLIPAAAQARSMAVNWGTLLLLSTAATALGLLACFVAWRLAGRRAIVDVLRAAHRDLSRPGLATAEIIRRAYTSLLALLAESGYRPNAHETVRDITGAVTQAFRLPPKPWEAVAALFEEVAYGSQALPPTARRRALAAFGELATWWDSDRPRVKP